MGSLDPTAEEFWPRNPIRQAQTVTFSYYGGVVPVPFPQAQLSSLPPPLSTSPTRSLMLSFAPSETAVSESSLRRELEVLGDVRGIQMERFRQGTVTVHFYDLRHAVTAFTAIRWHHAWLRNHHHAPLTPWGALPSPARGLLAGGTMWAQYTLPSRDAVPEGHNQGTVVVFNLDSEVDSETLREIFEAFGPVKEIRHGPSKKDQRLVEFFDIRDAAKALKHMNGKEIHGKQVVVEVSDGRRFWPQFAPRTTTVTNTLQCFSQPRLCSEKSIVTEVSHDKRVNAGTNIEVAIASLNLGEQVQDRVEEMHYSAKRNSVENQSSENAVESTKRQQPGRSRHWRGKQAKKHETPFLIKEHATAESSCVDSRTTVMIRNIPNKYSQKLLLNMLDNHCIHCNEQIGESNDQLLSSYDFVYLPIDFNNKCNVGYGFVNMTSPEATLRLYNAFHLQPWEVFNSRKICEVTYARVQGLKALKEHFKNSKFPYEIEQYLPVMFSPPRDGRQLTEPFPIVGQKHQTMILPIGPDREGASDDMLTTSRSQIGGIEGDDDARTG
ncbi:terminal ear1 [Spatholobus suberectus]|nr:terminal ear1 [Spatholobus suberectus]